MRIIYPIVIMKYVLMTIWWNNEYVLYCILNVYRQA